MNDEKIHEAEVVKSDYLERIDSTIAAQAQINASELGAKFLDAAIQQESEFYVQQAQNRVQELVSQRTRLQIQQERGRVELALIDKRIEAIRNGEFTLDSVTFQLRYKDITLNI